MFEFLRKIKFKRELAKKLERMAWEVLTNVQYDQNLVPDVEKMMKSLEEEIMNSLKKAEELKGIHTQEGYDERKKIEEQVNLYRQNMKKLAVQMTNLKEGIQTNQQKAGNLLDRRNFMLKNF